MVLARWPGADGSGRCCGWSRRDLPREGWEDGAVEVGGGELRGGSGWGGVECSVMERRKSARVSNSKRTIAFSDEEELEEEVLVKKAKLTSKGKSKQSKASTTEELGLGKRIRRKNQTFQNYKVYYDSDSDFDAGPSERRRSKSKTKRTPKNREPTKIEFLLDWKREIMISNPPTAPNSSKTVNIKKLIDSDLSQHGKNLQALFINVNWRTSSKQSGIKIDDFQKLDLNKKLMSNGIVFVWSEKEILGRLLKIMDEKGFFYIENFVIALLDASKADTAGKPQEEKVKPKTAPGKNLKSKRIASDSSVSTKSTDSSKNAKVSLEDDVENEYFLQNLDQYANVQADQLLYDGEAEYLKASKRVLMMFRRIDAKAEKLELRHQRTSDALFDLADPNVPFGASDERTKEYVYKLIETLLPKACYTPGDKTLKMMELWADSTKPREGWISVCEK